MGDLEVRLTNKCQLECKHCHAESGPHYDLQPIDICNLETMAIKYRQILEVIGYSKDEPIVVNFTGGEPTICGIDYIKKAIEVFQRELSKISSYIHFGVVTNLLIFKKDLLNLVKGFSNIRLFTSFDPEIRAINGSHNEFVKIWSKNYRQAKELGIDILVGMTITRQLLNFDLDSFIREYDIHEIYLLPLYPIGRAKKNISLVGVTRKEIADFIISVLKNRPGDIKSILLYDNVKDEYKKWRQTGVGGIDCWDDCHNSFSFRCDGVVTTPGSCVGSYGNIFTDDVKKILNSKNRLKLISTKMSYCVSECVGCQYLQFCRGGCITYKKKHLGNECRGMKSVLDYCLNN